MKERCPQPAPKLDRDFVRQVYEQEVKVQFGDSPIARAVMHLLTEDNIEWFLTHPLTRDSLDEEGVKNGVRSYVNGVRSIYSLCPYIAKRLDKLGGEAR